MHMEAAWRSGQQPQLETRSLVTTRYRLSNKIATKKVTGRRVVGWPCLLTGHRLKELNTFFLKTQCVDLKLKRGREGWLCPKRSGRGMSWRRLELGEKFFGSSFATGD